MKLGRETLVRTGKSGLLCPTHAGCAHKCANELPLRLGLCCALGSITMDASDQIDFPFDANVSGEFFYALESHDGGSSRFEAAVPPHILPETIAHWDVGDLY